MLRNAPLDTQQFSSTFIRMERALTFAAFLVLADLDKKAPYLGLRVIGAELGPKDFYTIVKDTAQPGSPCYRVSIKCNLLHDHFWNYFKDTCHLPLEHGMKDIFVGEKELEDAKLTSEQYGTFVGSFADILKSKNNPEPEVQTPKCK